MLSGVFLVSVLEQSDSLDDVFSWVGRVKVLDEVESFFCAFIFQTINDHVQSGFREELN